MQLIKGYHLFVGQYKPSTRRAYECVLEPMVRGLGEIRDVGTITAADVQEYAQMLRDRVACGKWSPATLEKHLKAIKTFWRWLVEMGEIEQSPARLLRQKRLKDRIGRDKAMADAELELVLRVTFGHARNYALVLFIAETGCRAGGAASLRVEDIHLETRRAMVLEKGEKRRPVWFGGRTAQALRVWLVQRPHGGEQVFCQGDGRGLTPEAISQIIRRSCKKAGVRSLGAHSLRHRLGHQLADAGIPVTVAAKALGHSDPVITMTYYYPDDDARAEEAVRRTHEPAETDSKVITLRRVRGD